MHTLIETLLAPLNRRAWILAISVSFGLVAPAYSQTQGHLSAPGASIAFNQASPLARALLADVLELDDGHQLAFLRIELEPGWKTYWKLPGRFGIAPQLRWAGSPNPNDLIAAFPAPVLFEEADGLSLGYTSTTVWPIIYNLEDAAGALFGDLELSLGLCETLCIPFFGIVPLKPDAIGAVPMAEIQALRSLLPVQSSPQQLELDQAGPDSTWVLEGEGGRHHIVSGAAGQTLTPSSAMERWQFQGAPVRAWEIQAGIKVVEHQLNPLPRPVR